MIGVPFDNNDLDCLSAISEVMVDLVERRDPLLLDLAQQFPTTEALAAWIRTLPQRDDEGLPDDGPKVDACVPMQRLRIPAPDPNCVERAALYLGVAELIDPNPIRQLATLDFDFGRHTFPIENGAPIILDPRVDPEEIDRRVASGEATGQAPAPPAKPVAIDVHDAIEYTSQLAEQGTRNLRNGPQRTWSVRNVIKNLVDSGIAPTDPRTLDTMGWFFAQAEQVARAYGDRALTIVRTTAAAIADLIDDILARQQRQISQPPQVNPPQQQLNPPRNLSFEIDGRHYAIPSWLTSAASTVGKIGVDLGAAYARPYLMGAGVTGEMLSLVEQELNAEGLSLGPLAKQGQSVTSAMSALSRKGK